MNKISNILAKNIKIIRKQLNLTQEQFAELTELSWKTVVNIESGKHFPKAINLDKICSKLNIEHFELFIDNDNNISKNAKLEKINSFLKNCDDIQLDNIYRISEAFRQTR